MSEPSGKELLMRAQKMLEDAQDLRKENEMMRILFEEIKNELNELEVNIKMRDGMADFMTSLSASKIDTTIFFRFMLDF